MPPHARYLRGAYDARGETTRLADMVFAYDAYRRHVKTTYDDGSVVTLIRDAIGRIASRTIDPAGTAAAVTTTYLYAGLYDPFGQPLDPVTLAVGTATSDDQWQTDGATGWHTKRRGRALRNPDKGLL